MKPHELSNEMTEAEANNVMAYWETYKPGKLDSANRLIGLGDSKTLAVSTIMLEKEHSTEMYEAAYYS